MKRVFRAVIGVQDLGEHRPPPRLFGPPDALRKPCHGRLLPASHISHFRLGQQMAWQIEGVGDHRRDHGAPDHGRDQSRILALIDDSMGQAKLGRDCSEGKARRHQEGRVHGLLVRRAEELRNRVDTNDFRSNFDNEKKDKGGGRGDKRRY
jgi:hypothetical protein